MGGMRESPNDLKLSDAEGWAGLLRMQETCAARSIRCSAWLGDVMVDWLMRISAALVAGNRQQ
jgi:hypothetical protein